MDEINEQFYPYKLLIERINSLESKHSTILSETLNELERKIENLYQTVMGAR